MMNALKRLSQSIGFTPAESRVAAFLVAAFLVGIGIKLYRGYADAGPRPDYAAMDAEFARAARALPPPDSARSSGYGAAAGLPADSSGKSRARSSRKQEVPRGSININTARKEDFMRLPGIGETTAERIVQYRRDHGPFSTLEELMNVKGIGKKKFERIAASCTMGK
jgi:competence ComEA-like helix-hairpin-helix protein